VALTATIYNFTIDLSDSDRGLYDSFTLQVAQHPSESPEYLVARMLAYCLEYAEGIAFSSGISDPDEPTLAVRDLTGAIRTWIEIGSPAATRLHKASKAAGRVAVYTHKDPAQLLRQLEGERIHKADAVEIFSFDRSLITALAGRLERRMAITVSIADGHLLVALNDGTFEGAIARHHLAAST